MITKRRGEPAERAGMRGPRMRTRPLFVTAVLLLASAATAQADLDFAFRYAFGGSC